MSPQSSAPPPCRSRNKQLNVTAPHFRVESTRNQQLFQTATKKRFLNRTGKVNSLTPQQEEADERQ